jgi:hypothetical protein
MSQLSFEAVVVGFRMNASGERRWQLENMSLRPCPEESGNAVRRKYGADGRYSPGHK